MLIISLGSNPKFKVKSSYQERHSKTNESYVDADHDNNNNYAEKHDRYIQSSLRTKDTLVTGILSSIRRLSLSRRLAIFEYSIFQ